MEEKTTKYDIESHGRLCLFGEHTDHLSTLRDPNNPDQFNTGYTLAFPIENGFYGYAERYDGNEYSDAHTFWFENKSGVDEYEQYKTRLCPKALLQIISSNHYFSYVASAALEMLNSFLKDNIKHGIHIVITKSTLPIGKGLSSSASIIVFIIKSFISVYDFDANGYYGDTR